MIFFFIAILFFPTIALNNQSTSTRKDEIISLVLGRGVSKEAKSKRSPWCTVHVSWKYKQHVVGCHKAAFIILMKVASSCKHCSKDNYAKFGNSEERMEHMECFSHCSIYGKSSLHVSKETLQVKMVPILNTHLVPHELKPIHGVHIGLFLPWDVSLIISEGKGLLCPLYI